MEKVSLSCAYCIHSVVSNFQGIRNPWLKDTCVFVWEQHTTGDDTHHQYNLGTSNTDFKMSGIDNSDKRRYFYSRNRNVLYADNVLTVS